MTRSHQNEIEIKANYIKRKYNPDTLKWDNNLRDGKYLVSESGSKARAERAANEIKRMSPSHAFFIFESLREKETYRLVVDLPLIKDNDENELDAAYVRRKYSLPELKWENRLRSNGQLVSELMLKDTVEAVEKQIRQISPSSDAFHIVESREKKGQYRMLVELRSLNFAAEKEFDFKKFTLVAQFLNEVRRLPDNIEWKVTEENFVGVKVPSMYGLNLNKTSQHSFQHHLEFLKTFSDEGQKKYEFTQEFINGFKLNLKIQVQRMNPTCLIYFDSKDQFFDVLYKASQTYIQYNNSENQQEKASERRAENRV